jgi:hypothetical protein
MRSSFQKWGVALFNLLAADGAMNSAFRKWGINLLNMLAAGSVLVGLFEVPKWGVAVGILFAIFSAILNYAEVRNG